VQHSSEFRGISKQFTTGPGKSVLGTSVAWLWDNSASVEEKTHNFTTASEWEDETGQDGADRPFRLSFGDRGLLPHEDSLVLLQIFLHGRFGTAGVGDANSIGLGQFVVDQQFADHSHLEIHFGHAPDLTFGEGLEAGAACGLDFTHD
jgi:hypothetical protein